MLGTPTKTMSHRSKKFIRSSLNPAEYVRMWPTPQSTDATAGEIMTGDEWVNPSGNPRRKSKSGIQGSAGLARAVKMLPTPTVQDAANNAGPSQMKRNTLPLSAVAGGQLNPMWVEWLMGWPIGMTDLEPLAMDKFRLWLQQHGAC
jgi:hypothetical protein